MYKESMKMLHSMNCTLVIRYYTCMQWRIQRGRRGRPPSKRERETEGGRSSVPLLSISAFIHSPVKCNKSLYIFTRCIALLVYLITFELLKQSTINQKTNTTGNRHKQNSWFCKEIREDNFRFWWRRVHEDASQGMYMSKIEIFFFTARILQNQRMLCCGEYFHD